MMRTTLALVIGLAAGGALLGGCGMEAAPAAASEDVIQRFLSSTDTPLTSYRAFRTMEAATRGGKMRARLDACTSLDPAFGFRYTILSEEGAPIIRNKVLRPALDTERTLRTNGGAAQAALVQANYDFTAADGTPEGLLRIGIHPRRRDTMLIEGDIFVRPDDADLVEVRGVLSRRPSFWTRRVEVVRRYMRIASVRVPVSMQSNANVLIVGASTFSMSYEYVSINNQPIATAGRAAGCGETQVATATRQE